MQRQRPIAQPEQNQRKTRLQDGRRRAGVDWPGCLDAAFSPETQDIVRGRVAGFPYVVFEGAMKNRFGVGQRVRILPPGVCSNEQGEVISCMDTEIPPVVAVRLDNRRGRYVYPQELLQPVARELALK